MQPPRFCHLLALPIALAALACFGFAAPRDAKEGSDQAPGGSLRVRVVGPESPQPGDDKAPARNDLYGEPLPPGALARMGKVTLGPCEVVKAVVVAVDGKVVISGSAADIRLCDLTTGNELRRLAAGAESLALSPDGKTLASATLKDPAVRLWNLGTGKEVGSALKDQVLVGFSVDGKVLITTTAPAGAGPGHPALYLWDVTTGTESGHVRLGTALDLPLAGSADGKMLAAAGPKGAILLVDYSTGKEVRRLPGKQGLITALAFSPDGKTLAAAEQESLVRLWDVGSGRELHHWERLTSEIRCLVFSRDGSLLAGAWGRWNLHVWETSTGKEREGFPANPHWITAVAFSADGKALVTVGANPLGLWDVATGKRLNAGPVPEDRMDLVCFVPDTSALATAGEDGTIRLWDPRTGKELRRWALGQGVPLSLAFSPDGKLLASSARGERIIRLWDPSTGAEVRQLHGHQAPVQALAFSADARTLFSAGDLGESVRRWDVATGMELLRFEIPKDPLSFAFSPDVQLLAATRADKIFVCEARTAKELSGPEVGVSRCAFIPTGEQLAYEAGSKVFSFDLAARKVRQTFQGDYSGVAALTFSPDGRMLAVAANRYERPVGRNVSPLKGVLDLWEVDTGKKRRRLVGHDCVITDAAFAPDGYLVATVAVDGTALVWEATAVPQSSDPPAERLSERQLDSLWADLGSDDAAKAFNAICVLTHAPRQAVSLLADRLRPVPADQAEKIRRLIADLDNEDFKLRERATNELAQLGKAAVPEMRRALAASPTAEARRRLEQLLGRPAVADTAGFSEQELRTARALEVLEHTATPEASRVLEDLGRGASDAWLTRQVRSSLARLRARPASPAKLPP